MADGHLLSAHDYSGVLALLERAATSTDRSQFATAVCEGLYALFEPCVSVSYNESSADASRAAAVIVPDPGEEWFRYFLPIYEAHMGQNPLMMALLANGGLPTPTDWGDTGRDAGFRDTPLYLEFYGPLGIENQLAVTVAVGDPSGEADAVVALAINTAKSAFTARERALLGTAAPLLAYTYRHMAQDSAPLLRPQGGAADPWSPAGSQAAAMRARLVVAGLTARQADVVIHASTGATNRQIARALAISPDTVRKHLENAYVTLGVANRAAAVAVALGGYAVS